MPMLLISLLNSLTDKELIDYALNKNYSIAIFRMPSEDKATIYISESSIRGEDGDNQDGFVAVSFTGDMATLIPSEYIRHITIDSIVRNSGIEYDTPTIPEEYERHISELTKRLRKRGGKTVYSVIDKRHCEYDLYSTFLQLAAAYPDTFVFCWKHADDAEAWIGATPEVLLECDGQTLYTMALAGTRKRDESATHVCWDDKNIEEQCLVKDFILNTCKAHGLEIISSTTATQPAGKIEHICTHITATLPRAFNLNTFTRQLSPTPAVCGMPRADAMADIKELESHSRKYYGGYCGIREGGKHHLFVTLRCMSLNPQTGCTLLYAGGGITAFSSPQAEWNEVNAKMNTLASVLHLRPCHK